MANGGTASDRQHIDVEDAVQALTGFVNTSTLLDLAHRFSATYSELAKTSTEHFLVTPVTALPTGKEKGKFLSIDVGGSNLRVGFIELTGEHPEPAEDQPTRSSTVGENVFSQVRRSHDKSWPIGDHLKMDQAEDLFLWIGDCIAEVVRDALEEQSTKENVTSPIGDEMLLGITFSFPMAQKSLSEATLLPMGKGFAITTDLNLGNMLSAGYARHCDASVAEATSRKSPQSPLLPRIRVAAITNDTVATFASLAYAVKAAKNSRVAMGLIVGTGTNATVPMKVADLHIEKQKALANLRPEDTVVINTEWTIRGTDKPMVDLKIKTRWDAILDANSDAPGFQPFEYMTSGRYLGEIVRLVFIDVVNLEENEKIPPSIQIKNALPTRFLSEVIARKGGRIVQQELEKRYPDSNPDEEFFWTVERVELIRDLAEAVQLRSSALVAAACIGLLACVGDLSIEAHAKPQTSNGDSTRRKHEVEELVIAYAGGTISQYPKWLLTCQQWIDTLVEEGSAANASKRVTLKESLDGGIIGAGVLAGMTNEIV